MSKKSVWLCLLVILAGFTIAFLIYRFQSRKDPPFVLVCYTVMQALPNQTNPMAVLRTECRLQPVNILELDRGR